MIPFVWLLASASLGQEFVAASIKMAEPVAAAPGHSVLAIRSCRQPDAGMLRCTGATLKTMLVRAYGVQSYQIDGPAWIGATEYDVMAKIPEGAKADEVPAMVRALLAERFAVKLHKESRLVTAYELQAGKGGAKLKEVDVSKLPTVAPGARPVMNSLSEMPAGALVGTPGMDGSLTARGNLTMAQLATHVTTWLGRPTIDSTGLAGTYAITLTFLAENDTAPDGGRVVSVDNRGGDVVKSEATTPVPTLMEALQILGLKLSATKTPVDIIVIDSAQKVPTEN